MGRFYTKPQELIDCYQEICKFYNSESVKNFAQRTEVDRPEELKAENEESQSKAWNYFNFMGSLEREVELARHKLFGLALSESDKTEIKPDYKKEAEFKELGNNNKNEQGKSEEDLLNKCWNYAKENPEKVIAASIGGCILLKVGLVYAVPYVASSISQIDIYKQATNYVASQVSAVNVTKSICYATSAAFASYNAYKNEQKK